MGIVASNKKVLEINETYRHWQPPVGGRDEAHDATASGGGGQDGESLSAQPQKREERDLERVGRADGIQPRLCQESAAATWATNQVRETSVSSGCAVALTTAPLAVLRRAGESGTDQDLENDGLHLRQAFAAGFTRVVDRVRAAQRAALRSADEREAVAD